MKVTGSCDTIMNQLLLNSCCVTPQTLTVNCYLTYVGSLFNNSRKENEKSLRFRSSRLFRTFVQKYEYPKLAES